MHDPNAQVNATTEVNFQIDKYYPVFGTSEKPFENSLQIRFTAVEGDYTAYFNFGGKYTPPRLDYKSKILYFNYPESYYNYLIDRLKEETAYIVYREYKDGHKWGEIYFDKYP